MTMLTASAHGKLLNGGEGETVICCGGCSIKGRRPQQEDVLMVHTDSVSGPITHQGEHCVSQGSHKGWGMVGVFDGHGGKRCSKYAGQHMPENVLAALQEYRASGAASENDNDNESIVSALKLAYRMTHEDFARMARGDADSTRPKTRQRLQMAIDKSRTISEGQANGAAGGIYGSRLSNSYGSEDSSLNAVRNRMLQQRLAMGPRVWDDGSTALCCFVNGNRVFVANVGDSRAVGYIGGKTIALSVDHKPNLPQEKARIHQSGGTVTSMMGCHRVMGMLAMSRALGDVMIEQYLSQEPDVAEQQLNYKDYIVMASDGLWDVVSSQEAVQIVNSEASRLGWSQDNIPTICNKLCTESFRRGSMDNITVAIIVALSPQERAAAGERSRGSGTGKRSQPASLEHIPIRTKQPAIGDNRELHREPMPPTHSNPAREAAADLWAGGAGGRKRPDSLAVLRPPGKTLMHNSIRSKINGENGHGTRGQRASAMHSTFTSQNTAGGLLPPSKGALSGGGYGVASAWQKDGGRSLRQMPVSKRAELLSGTMRASYY